MNLKKKYKEMKRNKRRARLLKGGGGDGESLETDAKGIKTGMRHRAETQGSDDLAGALRADGHWSGHSCPSRPNCSNNNGLSRTTLSESVSTASTW